MPIVSFRLSNSARAFLFCVAAAAAVTTFAPARAAAPLPDASSSGWDRHDAADDDGSRDDDRKHHGWRRHHHFTGHQDNEVVNVGDDSILEAGKQADTVVSVFGNTRVEGTVLDGVVAVFGNDYVDGKVGGDVVSVFGNVQLGPHAEVDGDVSSVFGSLRRDPAAIVHGDSHSVFAHDFTAPSGLRSWIDHCLTYGRPLSLAPGLGWAWGLALILLAFYLGIASVFRDAVARCAETFEMQPGHSVLAALLATLLTPVLIVLLCITIVGIAAVPFFLVGLFCLALFGKTVILAWMGRRILSLRNAGQVGAAHGGHAVLAVLLGGLAALALYLVPYLGFVIYKLLGFLGFGAVVYTAIQALQTRQAAKSDASQARVAAGAAAAAAASAAAATAAAASPGVTVDLPRAGFWIRMAALLLDVVLVGLVVSLMHGSHAHLVLLAAYGAIMWKLRGSTVGGIVFDLRVVRLDGRVMDWETSIIRALSCFLSLAVAGLGFFWIAFDGASQAWHDKIAGTVVVRVPKAMPRA